MATAREIIEIYTKNLSWKLTILVPIYHDKPLYCHYYFITGVIIRYTKNITYVMITA